MSRKKQNPLAYSLRILGIRPRSVRELRNRLTDRKYSKQEVREVTGLLKEEGYLDDKKLAKNIVQWTLAAKPCGRYFLFQKMLKKKISKKTAEGALKKYFSDKLERRQARLAYKKKLKLLSGRKFKPYGKKRKIALFLQGRGFSNDIIREMLEETHSNE